MKFWLEQKSFVLMWMFKKKQEKSRKSHFLAYGKLLAKKQVFLKIKTLKIWNFGKNEKVSSWCEYLKKNKKNKKSHFCGLRKIISQKTCFFLNQNRLRYEILVKTKKFRLDVTISKKQEKSKNTLFFGLEKIISRKTRFFLNQNRWRYEILVKTIKYRLDVTISKNKKIRKKSFFQPTEN